MARLERQENLKISSLERFSREEWGEGEGGAATFPPERILLASECELCLHRKGPFSPEREED